MLGVGRVDMFVGRSRWLCDEYVWGGKRIIVRVIEVD